MPLSGALGVRARVCGADDALSAVLGEVLEELGIKLSGHGDGESPPDLVLVLVQRGDSVLRLLQVARDGTGRAPVLVLLPFADEKLEGQATGQGAFGCYALGTPLDRLRTLIVEAVDRLRLGSPAIETGRGG